MILDATAGNRHIWGKNKHPEDVVFMDKEKNLKIPPDIIATWKYLPFRDDIFECVIFDPSHQTAGINLTSRWAATPDETKGTWYGAYRNNREMKTSIFLGAHSLAKIATRMCLKWHGSYERGLGIEDILKLFLDWEVQFITVQEKTNNKRVGKTWWVKMVRRGGV